MALEYFPDSVLTTPVNLNAPYFDPGYPISNKSLSPTTNRILARRKGDRAKAGTSGGGSSGAAKEATVAGGVLPAGATAAAVAAATDAPSGERSRGRLRRLLSRG